MFTQGIYPIGDGLLDIDEARLKGLLVQDDINDIYDVEQTPFARGKFAAVRRAIHKNSGVHFAAKFLKRRRRAQSSDKEIKHEIAVLMLCDGADNIVKLNAVHESRSDTALLLELATGGELQTFLDNEECLSEVQARACMREVLKALQFLHNRSIAHLDLKPQNILLAGERIEDGLKLCDFGISRVVAEGTNVREIVGTPDYVAPEVLQYEPLSLLTDIWSVGVLTYVLLSGFSPFGGDTKQETFLNISQCALTFPDKLFGGVSAPAIDFMRRALRIKPGDRMTAAGCLEHVWLKNECSIDRQIFNNISKTASAGDEVEEDDDDDDQDESFEEEEEEEEEDDEELDEFSNSDNNITSSNGHKMDSSDIEQHSNGSIQMNGSSCSNYNSDKVQSLLTSKGKPAIAIYSASNGSTKKATAIISVPAIRATTIPLTMPTAGTTHHQPSQLLHVAARRHSSDANKENTYLATKKVTTVVTTPQLSSAIGGTKKPPSLTTTAATLTAATANHAVATIAASTTPGAISHDKHSASTINAVCCIFPDAPTTPKVIRKAPTTDTSPTSVKALVKKFQLEVGGSSSSYNGDGSRASSPAPTVTATTTTLVASATVTATATSVAHLKESAHQNHQPQHIIGNNNVRNANASQRRASTAASMINSSRGNETKTTNNRKSTGNASLLPTEGPESVYLQKSNASSPPKKSSNCVAVSLAPSTAATTTSSNPACNNFKTTCVFCLTCSNSNSNATSNNHNTASSTSTVSSCGHATTAASNGSTTAAAAILLSSHKQLQHHHHHAVHHVQKSAANNLSLDQGIIC